MFGKKTCARCRKKIGKDFSYCPFCGFYNQDKEKEQKDYGFLGKKDVENLDLFGRQEIKLPFGFNMVFNKLMKEMDKQFHELDREIGKEKEIMKTRRIPMDKTKMPFMRQGGISINISSGAGTPVIKVRSFGNMPEFKEMEQGIKGDARKERKLKIENPKISEEKAKALAKLPRQEAESKVRRLSGKVIYEIGLPNVKSEKDIVVNQLENSIEVKAFSKDKAYFKFLPVSLPLQKYKLEDGKLILELGEE